MKNIALFIDGTGNHGYLHGSKNTNVFELYKATIKDRDQLTHYIRGIGTHETPTPGLMQKIADGYRLGVEQVFGKGATMRIKEAYRFLAEHYQPNDKVYILGFSRGAYIARVLAHFVNEVGVLLNTPESQSSIVRAFELFWHQPGSLEFKKFISNLPRHSPQGGAESIKVHFLGQWDTVSAIKGHTKSEADLRKFVERDRNLPLPDWISHARHALALHDMRKQFAPMLWSASGAGQSLEQLWFAGAHADVGGGYESHRYPGTALSIPPLHWMAAEARKLELRIAPLASEYEDLPALESPHDSNTGFLFGFFPAQIREQLNPKLPLSGVALHHSVIERLWELPELSYQRGGTQRRAIWNKIDQAAMQIHYKNCFPNAEAGPLSPILLHQAMMDLHSSIAGNLQLSDDELFHLLRLLRAFSIIALVDHTVPAVISATWQQRLDTASDKVYAPQPQNPALLTQYIYQNEIFLKFYLNLKLKQKTYNHKRLKI